MSIKQMLLAGACVLKEVAFARPTLIRVRTLVRVAAGQFACSRFARRYAATAVAVYTWR
jgi:hypothetical protein